MLVLTRKPGQSIFIGDGIEVSVLSVTGEKVRIGIAADRDIPIYRNEVHERMKEERAESDEEEEDVEESVGTAA